MRYYWKWICYLFILCDTVGCAKEPLFTCQPLLDVCIGELIKAECVVPGNNIEWRINGQCQIPFGSINGYGSSKTSSNCPFEAIAKVLYKSKNMIASQLRIKLNETHENVTISVSCSKAGNNLFKKFCPLQIARRPSHPVNITVTTCNNRPVLTWTTSEENSHIRKSYTVTVFSSTSKEIIQQLDNITTTHTTLDNLKPGDYHVIVKAITCIGESEPSESVKIVIKESTITLSPPGSINIKFVSHEAIKITWKSNSSQINICYDIKIGNQVYHCIHNNSYIYNKLKQNSHYTVQIRTVLMNSSACSNWSEPKCFLFVPQLRPDFTYSIISGDNDTHTLQINVKINSVCDIVPNCLCPPPVNVTLQMNDYKATDQINADKNHTFEVNMKDLRQHIIGNISVENHYGRSPFTKILINNYESSSGNIMISNLMIITLTLVIAVLNPN